MGGTFNSTLLQTFLRPTILWKWITAICKQDIEVNPMNTCFGRTNSLKWFRERRKLQKLPVTTRGWVFSYKISVHVWWKILKLIEKVKCTLPQWFSHKAFNNCYFLKVSRFDVFWLWSRQGNLGTWEGESHSIVAINQGNPYEPVIFG